MYFILSLNCSKFVLKLNLKEMKLAKSKSLLIAILVWLPFLAFSQDCSNFCVWPGDGNNNGVANHFDVLQLGVASNSTGPFRVDWDVDWDAKEAEDWTESFVTNNANFKHADANGDGFIDINDIYPIGDNFGSTNALFTGTPEGNNITGPDLTATLNQTTYTDGQLVTIKVSLGSQESPVSDLIGLAFSLEIDTQYVQQVIEPVTWEFGLIGPESDLYLFDKWEPGISDAIHFAFARNNGIPINGYGDILTVQLVIDDNLSLRYSEPQPYEINIKDVLGIDALETDLLITSQGDEATLLVTTAVNELTDEQISIRPNPFNNTIKIYNKENLIIENITVHDVYGRVVYDRYKPENEPDLSSLITGVYYLSIQTDQGIYSTKIVKSK